MAKTKNKKTKEKRGFLSRNYSLSFKFLKESKNYVYAAIILFLFSAVFGFVFPVFFSEMIKKFLQDVLEKTANMNLVQLITFIIENNLKSSLIGMATGIFFGIFPVVTALVNGYVLGFVANKSVSAAGPLILTRLFPHGIFELPALIISLGVGLKLGTIIFAKNKAEALRHNVENALRVFLFIVLPLIVIAGIIEGLLIWFIG